MLFDLRATHSFISDVCVDYLRLPVSKLPCLLVVSTPTSRSLATNFVCLQAPQNLRKQTSSHRFSCSTSSKETLAWISAKCVTFDCTRKTLSFSSDLPPIMGSVTRESYTSQKYLVLY